MRLKTLLSALLACGLGACMSEADIGRITSAVDTFHSRQAARQDEEIYRAAAPAFRSGATLADVRRFNDIVRAANCSPSVGPSQNWNNAQTTSGHFITISYPRSCERGEIVETFRFMISGNDALLVSYNAQGMALFPPAAPPIEPQPEAPLSEPNKDGGAAPA